MTRWPLANAVVVGFTRPWKGLATFAPADLVLYIRDIPAQRLQVVSYPSDDEVDGIVMSAAEWHALLRADEAATVPTFVAAQPHATGWLLRPVITSMGKEQQRRIIRRLQDTGGTTGTKIRNPDGARLLLVDDRTAETLREELAETATRSALGLARCGMWDKALLEASFAFVVTVGLRVDRVALLALLHDHAGNTTRAAGLISMAANSRGASWAAEVVAAQKTLAAELGLEVP